MNQHQVPFLKNIGVHSPDFDEARNFINSRIDNREVSPLSSGSKTDNILTWQPLADSTLFGASWSEKVHIQSEPQTTFHAILVLFGGILCKTSNTHITTGGLILIAPGQQADLVWEKSTRAVVINLSRRALIDHLGVPSLELLRKATTILQPEHQDAQLLKNEIVCIARHHEICGGEINARLQKQWESLLLTHLSGPIQLSGQDCINILPGRVRLATEWIHAHISDPISVSELLKITKTSRRSLESGFRDYLNTTPAKYILCHKLKGVRERLLSSPDTSIGDVAVAFGFNHLSNFARQYHDAFGELPSETVRQRRESRFITTKKARLQGG
ncbi:helix-turn-helix domain-containing protein [Marinobacter sp.]|uniref:helix-turn-helix domain-containing protein n=1 Tax=Marinobacter sp. TaxID=50741 RepID=UPI003A93C6E7